MYKAIIFDLDGTLLDTVHDIRKVLNDTLRQFNCPELTIEQTLSYIGNGAHALCESALPQDKKYLLEEFFPVYKLNSQDGDNNLTKLFNGERKTLERLQKAGLKLCILTNKPQVATEKVIAKRLPFVNFEMVVGNRPDLPLKPRPEGAEYIIDCLGVDKKDCLFVGDGETDVLTAKNAGIDCVSVLWGYRDEQTLKNFGAAKFVSTFKELENLIF